MTYAEWLAKYTLLIGSDGADDDKSDDDADDASGAKDRAGTGDDDKPADDAKDTGAKGGGPA